MKKHGSVAVAIALVLAAGACSKADDGAAATDDQPSGEITVLTQRTDIVDPVFQDYKKKFEAKYPDVTVKFEAITDYEGEVRIRMNTKDYGDVLLIPNSLTAEDYQNFFEPLGTVADLKKKYKFVEDKSFDGKVYGLSITGNAMGFVYNKKVWKQAGITSPPKTPDEFIAALQSIKDKTGAVPLYTNYKDGWPVTQWDTFRGIPSGNANATIDLGKDPAPWTPGKDYYVIDSLMYDIVKAGLIEKDPTTTNWEQSKPMIGTGKIATMALGSWAITQMQEAATDHADIGYLPFPMQAGGKFHSVMASDYRNAININSKHKAAARAWIDWFADESNYALDQGGISPLVGAEFPATLNDFKTLGVEMFEMTPEPAGSQGLTDKISVQSEIALSDPKYHQRLIDSARGASKETKEQIFADLNKKWADTEAKLK